MSDISDIDELLNSFIDGELPQRQQVELRRLMAHDPQIIKRLRELQKCKILLGSLPFAKVFHSTGSSPFPYSNCTESNPSVASAIP